LYEVVEDRGVIDDKKLWHSEMIGVLGTNNDIRARVFEKYVRTGFVCGRGGFRKDCGHGGHI